MRLAKRNGKRYALQRDVFRFVFPDACFDASYTREGSEDWEYSDKFSDRNDEALGTLMSQMIKWRGENDATEWVKAREADQEQAEQAA